MEKTIIVNLKGAKEPVLETIEIIKSMSGVKVIDTDHKTEHLYDEDCPFCRLEQKTK